MNKKGFLDAEAVMAIIAVSLLAGIIIWALQAQSHNRNDICRQCGFDKASDYHQIVTSGKQAGMDKIECSKGNKKQIFNVTYVPEINKWGADTNNLKPTINCAEVKP